MTAGFSGLFVPPDIGAGTALLLDACAVMLEDEAVGRSAAGCPESSAATDPLLTNLIAEDFPGFAPSDAAGAGVVELEDDAVANCPESSATADSLPWTRSLSDLKLADLFGFAPPEVGAGVGIVEVTEIGATVDELEDEAVAGSTADCPASSDTDPPPGTGCFLIGMS